ncbi:MAG: hypothetical protein ACLRWP_15645 [Bilophila wadsworthia]
MQENTALKEAVLYFPGCGSLLSALSACQPWGCCCGRASLLSCPKRIYAAATRCCLRGADAQFAQHGAEQKALQATIAYATKRGFRVTHIVTACGSCREGIERLEPSTLLGEGGGELVHLDVMQFVQGRMDANPDLFKGNVLYHASCHPEWVGVHKVKGVQKQAGAIARLTGAAIEVSPGCCGESGMGAIASPLVYNTLRKRKMDVLEAALADYPAQSPILVGCPSCKVGITRSLMAMHERSSPCCIRWNGWRRCCSASGGAKKGFGFFGAGLRPVRMRRACGLSNWMDDLPSEVPDAAGQGGSFGTGATG